MTLLLPIMAFLFVFFVTYALLAKIRILGENNFIHLFISFIIAIIFAISPGAKEFTVMTMPWIAVLLVIIFSVLIAFAFVKGSIEDIVKSSAVAIIIVTIVLLIFFISALNVFGPFFSQYMPGPEQKPGIISFLINPAVLGAIILLIIAAITSWILTKH
ncbi:MAG: hypothetical protein QW041_01215 [Candidatus Pacearchaeota archaeon]